MPSLCIRRRAASQGTCAGVCIRVSTYECVRLKLPFQARCVETPQSPMSHTSYRDPTIKREVCKGCGTLLVPGATAQVRVRAKRDTHVVVTCTTCNRLRRFLNRPGHHLHHSVEVVHTITSPAMFAPSDADTVAPAAVASEAGAALSEPKALNQQTQDVDDEAYAQEMRDAHTDREGDDVI